MNKFGKYLLRVTGFAILATSHGRTVCFEHHRQSVPDVVQSASTSALREP